MSYTARSRVFIRLLLASLSINALVLALASGSPAAAQSVRATHSTIATASDTLDVNATPTPQDVKVTLCHATSTGSNSYEAIDVSINSVENAISVHGHGDHKGPIFPADNWGDIIPPFDYGSSHYPGMNWTDTGQAIWGAGCQVPTDPPVHIPGLMQANKTSSLHTDADDDGQVSPGDTLVYTISVKNIGGEVVTDVVFLDTLDPNTTLVVGSVQTSSGTVTTGNTPGDTSVKVNIGSVPPSAGDQPGAIITFLAVIANPFPASAQHVSNQGVISSTRGVTVTYDGNDVLQPEITPVYTTVALEITPVAPQCVLPGTTFSITWRITNTGNVALTFGQLSSIVSGSGTGSATQDLSPIAASSAVSVEQPIHAVQPVDYGAEVITVTTEVITTTPPVTNSVAAVKAPQQVMSLTTTIGICAPDLRGATAVVTSSRVFAHEVLTYTWVLKNTGSADAINTNAILTPTNLPLLGYADALTATSGTAVWNVAANRVEWRGDLHMSDVVTVEFTTESVFGLPHASLTDPFIVSHAWRPTFYGMANYQYPYKLFFMLVLRNSTP